jgi:uncharacterized protein (TIGR02117 family)
LKRILRNGLMGLAALLVLLAGLVIVTARPGDPRLFPAGREGLEVVLVSNGYHAGLALPRGQVADLASAREWQALASVSTRFQHYEWIEVGWGDAAFYRSTPTTDDLQWRLAWQALSGQGAGTALHVVGVEGELEQAFPAASLVRIRLSPEGFARLGLKLEESFASDGSRQPQEMGPGLYGPSLFYKATGRFNLFRVCNHWIADLLDAAGVPTTPLIAVLPAGLLADLKWRSGLSGSR